MRPVFWTSDHETLQCFLPLQKVNSQSSNCCTLRHKRRIPPDLVDDVSDSEHSHNVINAFRTCSSAHNNNLDQCISTINHDSSHIPATSTTWRQISSFGPFFCLHQQLELQSGTLERHKLKNYFGDAFLNPFYSQKRHLQVLPIVYLNISSNFC